MNSNKLGFRTQIGSCFKQNKRLVIVEHICQSQRDKVLIQSSIFRGNSNNDLCIISSRSKLISFHVTCFSYKIICSVIKENTRFFSSSHSTHHILHIQVIYILIKDVLVQLNNNIITYYIQLYLFYCQFPIF